MSKEKQESKRNELFISELNEIGGKEWVKNGSKRIYLNFIQEGLFYDAESKNFYVGKKQFKDISPFNEARKLAEERYKNYCAKFGYEYTENK